MSGHEGVSEGADHRLPGSEAGTAFVGEGSRSLEVRWIHHGPVPPVLVDWFGVLRDPIERRADRYLVDPGTPELGVKIRDAVQLDVKAYRGSPGSLRLSGGDGALETWEKWTFPLGETGLSPGQESEGWVMLGKTRRRRAFELIETELIERSVVDEIEPGCTVELTEFDIDGDTWWTLAFESSGPEDTLEPSLRGCTELFLDHPLPDGIELTPRTSRSYTRWLGERSGRPPPS